MTACDEALGDWLEAELVVEILDTEDDDGLMDGECVVTFVEDLVGAVDVDLDADVDVGRDADVDVDRDVDVDLGMVVELTEEVA